MLGIVFVLLVCFLRRGLIGGVKDLYDARLGGRHVAPNSRARPPCRVADARPAPLVAAAAPAAPMPAQRRKGERLLGTNSRGARSDQTLWRPLANSDIDFSVNHGEMRGIIGPNGAGKTTFFKMLTCEIAADLRPDRVRGPRHHRHDRHRRLPARPDQELSGQSAVHSTDSSRESHDRRAGRNARQIPPRSVPPTVKDSRPGRTGRAYAGTGQSDRARRVAGVSSSPTARSGGSRSAWRWRARRACCCSTNRSPA